jgi:antitoxin ParD1/3/4
MSIDFDKETERFIENELRAGRFHDAASLIGAAVRHLLITREDIGYSRAEIDTMIAQAIDSFERGEGMDGEDFFAELEKEERELQRRRA